MVAIAQEGLRKRSLPEPLLRLVELARMSSAAVSTICIETIRSFPMAATSASPTLIFLGLIASGISRTSSFAK